MFDDKVPIDVLLSKVAPRVTIDIFISVFCCFDAMYFLIPLFHVSLPSKATRYVLPMKINHVIKQRPEKMFYAAVLFSLPIVEKIAR